MAETEKQVKHEEKESEEQVVRMSVPSSEPETVGDKKATDAVEVKSEAKLSQLAASVGLTLVEVQEKQISRNELKRRLKNKKWNDEKEERRKMQKEKRKRRKISMREEGREPLSVGRVIVPMKDSLNRVKIAIDLSYEEYMNEKELRKLRKQIQRVYSVNRRFSSPCQLYLTSVTGDTKSRLEKQQPGFLKWDLFCHEEHYLDVLKEHRDNGTLCFLSPESPNKLPESASIRDTGGQYAYVIGGLVDHNVHKGLTFGLAKQHGIEHGRLPIDEYVKMTFGRVLTVNHVFEIMLYASVGTCWSEAFYKIIPQRKLRQEEEHPSCSSSSSSSSSTE